MMEMTAMDYLHLVGVIVLPGAFAKCIVAPIERVKLLLQTQDVNPRILQKVDVKFKGIVDCFRRVLFEQGVCSFWRGSLAVVLRHSHTQISTFLMKDDIRRLIPRYNPKKDFWNALWSNAASRSLPVAAGYLVTYPLDYAQLRLASDIGRGQRTYKGILECISKTMQVGGIVSLYRGFTVSVIAVMQLRGIQLGLFDTVMELNPYRKETGIIGETSKFTAAQVASISAQYAAYPLDTVRRRLQMESDLPKASRKYSGFFNCCYKIFREESLLGFYKGAATNAVLRTGSTSLALLFYYEMKSRFQSDDDYFW